MSRFINQKIRNLEAYIPGEQPTDMQYVKLNTNESPFPPSRGVLEAINTDAVAQLKLYPDPCCKKLKERLAAHYSVEPCNVFVSNGSDDILNFSFMAFCDGNKRPVKFPEISYGFYKVYAELYGIQYVPVPLKDDFSICIEDYFGNDGNVVIANPNAPTGLMLSVEEVEAILRANPDFVVLIDEAYVDFGGVSCVDLVKQYKNLLVVRTYSKSYSMAGARLGFAIGDSELILDLEKVKFSTNPYNINRLTLLAGEAAIDDHTYYENNCRIIAENREYTQEKLRSMGFVCTESKANFIFAKCERIGGEELYLALKQRGILVRHFSNGKIVDFNRITVGTREQMEILLTAIKEILKEKDAEL